MKAILIFAALAAACKAKPPAALAPAAADAPAAVVPAAPNAAERYVGALQTDVQRAKDAKEKADAAVKKEQEAEKLPE